MSWQYRTRNNEYGHPQVYDYSQCPPRAVCSSCYSSYTNILGEKTCSDCRNPPDEVVESGQTTMELENKYGFIDHVLVENGEIVRFGNGDPMPVCPSCLCHVMPNRGGGSVCDTCDHELTMHCMHDEF